MSSKNKNENNLQDQQASILNETYKLGWMDGYAEGYDDAVEDTENALNDLENQNELLREIVEEKDSLIDELASNAGKSLQAVKKR
ncbi:hypothetical protein [Parathalassolituus penaei]|uniref:Uncharacterized protein n=1 Tax=Parathalassolituus penaei TaxID=2997323 RepID=A0A9X3ITM7_9GAMM|nr:hypothetical protein [Parathalassolituus penaei]MCY0965333.1 hypothetical protein [Parathalassolituus penaei]